MPNPIVPSDYLALIPKPGGNFCERFLNSVFGLPLKIFQDISYQRNEDGSFTEEFKADFCSIVCKCGPGGVIVPGGLAAPSNVNASDGQFDDRIQVTWNTVNGATAYDVYRNTLDNSASANVIATNLGTPSYEDAAITPGQYYYYFVKARNTTASSGFSSSERGHAGSVSTTLPAITDLAASQGFLGLNARLSLVFTPVSGAESYDIYRSTADDFTTATLIDADRSPFDTSVSLSLGAAPFFVDNGGELVYMHDPGAPFVNYYTKYYFWVVAKRSGPPAQSPPSNSARGWVAGIGDGIVAHTSDIYIQSNQTITVPGIATKYWAALHAGGSAGAGGGVLHGGGGGGGAAIVVGWFPVSGGKIRVKSTPESDTGPTASATSGAAGPITVLEYSANGLFTDTVVLMTGDAPPGGIYNAGGNGAGGAGATGSKHASVQDGVIFNGRAGKPAVSAVGGRSGQRFGHVRWPGAHFNGFAIGSFAGFGDSRGSGSGSYASPSNPALAVGGGGKRGFAILSQYVT